MSDALERVLETADGHRWTLQLRVPAKPRARLLWLPAMGVSARHYLPLAEALAGHGVAVGLHEWRGQGSSNLRASRSADWGYRELLLDDIPASHAALAEAVSDVPQLLGGHSLGGQLACMLAGLQSEAVPELWLVASGSAYWRAFPAPLRWALPLLYRVVPWLARARGHFDGHRLGFAGREARSVMADWARTGVRGDYRVERIEADIDAAMASATPTVHAIVLADDWLAPPGSTARLASRLPAAKTRIHHMDAAALGTEADHFAWMKQPAAVARLLASTLDDASASSQRRPAGSD